MYTDQYIFIPKRVSASITNRMRLVLWSLSLLIAATIQLRARYIWFGDGGGVEKKFTPPPPPPPPPPPLPRIYIYTYTGAHTTLCYRSEFQVNRSLWVIFPEVDKNKRHMQIETETIYMRVFTSLGRHRRVRVCVSKASWGPPPRERWTVF